MPKRFYKITPEEFQELQTFKKSQALRDEEQLQYQREQSIKVNNLRIIQKTREQEFRKSQIEKGVSDEKSEIFFDGKKRIFQVQNDYNQTELELENLNESNRLLKEEMDKNAN